MDCEHRPACPGCPLAEVAYADQLLHKQARLARALAPYGHLPAAPEVRPSAWTEGYRHRLKLPVASAPARAIGLYDREGAGVLDTPRCQVLHPELRDALAAVRTWLADRSDVHSVDLRRSHATGELQLVLAMPGGELPGGRGALAGLVAAVPALSSVAVSRADPDGKRVMGAEPKVIHGRPWLSEQIGSTAYRIHPGAFFQADPRQAEALHGLVRSAVGEAASVLDLYAGVGAYALALAPGRRRVLAVEEVADAARAAASLAPANVEVRTGRVEQLKVEESFDVAVLNPARRGADPGVLVRLASLAERLVYVSCGPETLARDLDVLSAHGMRVVDIQAIDLFPQTSEVETVVTLARGRARTEWTVPGGRARTPWLGEAGGAVGKAARALVLVVGETPETGVVAGSRFRRIATVAGHSLLRVELGGPLPAALGLFSRNGNPLAGSDPRTARFFAERAGLLRPFLHVERAGTAAAPLQGDLVAALRALGADERVVARAGSAA
jgi:23S rRNA (uracil1939-C5)-methyltransferase